MYCGIQKETLFSECACTSSDKFIIHAVSREPIYELRENTIFYILLGTIHIYYNTNAVRKTRQHTSYYDTNKENLLHHASSADFILRAFAKKERPPFAGNPSLSIYTHSPSKTIQQLSRGLNPFLRVALSSSPRSAPRRNAWQGSSFPSIPPMSSQGVRLLCG